MAEEIEDEKPKYRLFIREGNIPDMVARQKEKLKRLESEENAEWRELKRNKPRTTREFVRLMADLSQETQAQSRRGYHAFLAALSVFLEEGNSVKLPGTGVIEWQRTPDRVGSVPDWEGPLITHPVRGLLTTRRKSGALRGTWGLRFKPEKKLMKAKYKLGKLERVKREYTEALKNI